MQGFITEKNWKEIDRTFAGLHRFYQHLPRKPHTFLELLELYHTFDDDQPAQGRQTQKIKRSMRRIAVVLLSLAALCGFLVSPQAAQAQAEAAPAEASVEAAVEEPALPRATLKLLGANCDVNAVESALLRVKGVAGVDVESKKGHMIVDYDSKLVTTQQMVDTLARKKGCFAREVK